MKKIILIILAVFLVGWAVLMLKNQKIEPKTTESLSFVAKIEPKEQKISTESQETLKIGGKILNIEIADTEAKRKQGLSGKSGLAPDQAMLFVFDAEGYYGIWMKDMNFAIDIIWLNKDKKIIYTEKNVSPKTYPKVFYAKSANLPILSLYVVEIPSGFLAENNIQIGDFVAF